VVEIRAATLADIDYICHLQRIEANREDAIGFIPRVCYENEVERRRNGRLFIAYENNDRVGFAYTTHSRGVTHIQQIAVQDDARRIEVGTALVAETPTIGDWLLSLRCRENLPAVAFWENLGFELQGVDKTPTKRRQHVLRFSKIIGGLWLPDQPRRAGQEAAREE
jgi:GNAT superfamily N-acetyltransferase|tara:strand:+ start:305 stop:802 length:498 start_codon:yes stop_codon:yes gene_type:complete